MNFPKKDFSIGIFSHKSRKDTFHADILVLEQDSGRLALEELECLYTPVNEIIDPSGLVHCSGKKQIEQHLNQRRQSIPPFRIILQSGDAELFFQSETHFEQGKYDRLLHIYPRCGEALAPLKQLQGLAVEIAGENIGSRQLEALEQLSASLSGKYDIQIAVSDVFLKHLPHEIDALNIWNDIRTILHGEKLPNTWPCRKESYVELQLTNIASGLFYNIAFKTQNILTAGNKCARRKWIISERIDNIKALGTPVFQSDDQASILNGKKVTALRTKSRLTECLHPFAKEILAL